MNTWWLYATSVRFKTCPILVRRMLDKEYKVDARNKRPECVRNVLWRINNRRNCEEFL